MPITYALPFLEENQQHAYDLGDGKRLLMRVNQSRILMMVTASQDRQIPNSHHWGQAAEIASDDVESWQLVSFDTTTHQINTIHYYDRETLDRIGRTNTYGFDDAQAIKTYELGDFDVEGINQLGERAQRFIGLPKELVSEIALFQERKAEIVNLVSQLKVKRDLWRGKLHKVAGQDTWLQIKDSQIGLFNSIDGPQQFLGYGFALESLEKYVLVGTSTSMEPDVVRVVDVNKLREDVASGELKREHVVMRWDKPKYTTTVLIRPGKLDEAGYETARSALTFLNGLEVEN